MKRFRGLRGDHGIEVFPDRLGTQAIGLGQEPRQEEPAEQADGETFVGEQPDVPGVGHHRRVTLPPGVDPDQPVAQVGPDQPLTQQQFAEEWDRAVRGLAMDHDLQYTDELRQTFDRFRGEFLEMYTTQRALVREAEARGIEVTDEELDIQLTQVRARWGDRFDQTLTDLGFADEAAYRDSLREGLLAQRVVDEFRGDVQWTDEELQEFHELHRGRYFRDQAFDQVCPEVEQRFVSERLQERFRDLRGEHGIEVFPDRLRHHQPPIGTN
jgi:hypothetical protein